MRDLGPVLLLVVLLSPFSVAAADEESGAAALVAEHCASGGGEAAECACLRDTFEEQVLARVSSPKAALLAAYIHTDDQMALMQAMQTTDSQTMQEAGMAISTAQSALEACAAEREESAETETVAMPEGDDPRSRFIRRCAEDNQRPDICACIADKALETLSPRELELMADMRAAENRGEDPVAVMAEERGLTEEEAKEGLAAITGRISGAMMAINPMECVNP